jgi:hypothetical protein
LRFEGSQAILACSVHFQDQRKSGLDALFRNWRVFELPEQRACTCRSGDVECSENYNQSRNCDVSLMTGNLTIVEIEAAKINQNSSRTLLRCKKTPPPSRN